MQSYYAGSHCAEQAHMQNWASRKAGHIGLIMYSVLVSSQPMHWMNRSYTSRFSPYLRMQGFTEWKRKLPIFHAHS